VVVDSQAHILGFGSSDYASSTSHQKWIEQDPDSLLAGMVRSGRSAIEQSCVKATDCAGLSIGGAMHSLIALDHLGNPLTGVITWADGRGAPQAQAVRQSTQAAELYKQTGCPAHGMYPLYKILWLRQEHPALFAQAARFITAKEFVFQKLTGKEIVDYSIASGSGLLNTHTLKWNSLSLEVAGIRSDHLAQPASPLTIFRGLDPSLAKAMGISSHTPAVLGSSDAANSNFGAGAVNPWQATCMIGTSGAFRIVTSKPTLDKQGRLWCYAIDETHWLVGGAINNGGITLSWLKDALNQTFSPSPSGSEVSIDDLISLAGEVETGANGLICLPFFAGERSPNWNLNARAVFFGLALQHDIRHIARSLLEGVAFRLRGLNEILSELVGDISEIRASGGFTHSELWPQIIASTLNRNLLAPAWGDTSCLGAAFWAMLGVGRIPSFESADDLITIGSQYFPIAKDATVYNQLYPIYAGLYESIKPAFDQIAQVQRDLALSTA
jgi:gluconokinase